MIKLIRHKKVYLTNKMLLIVYVVALLFSSGCSGCSKSGIRSKQLEKQEQMKNDDYSEKNGTNEIDRSGGNTETVELPGQSKESGLTLDELYEMYNESVFMVITSDGYNARQGTGFFISEDGYALSNYHVFEGTLTQSSKIETMSGVTFQIESVKHKSRLNDFILFKVDMDDSYQITPIPIANKEIRTGVDVFTIGNPRGLQSTLSKGIVSGFRENNKYIQTTTEITHGSSGGPLINMQGNAIGITTSGVGEANLNFAINLQYIQIHKYLNQ